MRTGNPTLRPEVFGAVSAPSWASLGASHVSAPSNVMTMGGVIIKSGVLLAVCSITAVLAYSYASQNPALVMPMVLGGALAGLVLSLIITFATRSAPFLAVPFAACEGVFCGAVSLIVAQRLSREVPDLGVTTVFQAVLLTFGIFAAMLIAYSTRLIRMNNLIRNIIVVGTMGVGITYLVSLVLRLITGDGIGFIHSNGPLGIGFSVVVVALASFNLLLDFEFVEQGTQQGAPKYLEWYGAFALLTTLVWLYIEVLRLLSKLRK